MTPNILGEILTDIDKQAEGEAVAIAALTVTGDAFGGAFQTIGEPPRVLILSRPDLPPLYLPAESIVSVTLWDGDDPDEAFFPIPEEPATEH